MPHHALNNKRDSSIANTFKSIDDLISKLKQIQEAAGQTGTPDFSKASGYLAQLAQTAESADSALVALGSNKLDDSSANSIGGFLASSAKSVVSITALIQKGKDWFKQNNATQKVIQILQANIDQFHQLFIDLNSHTPGTYALNYKPDETRIICSMINAVAALDASQVSSSAKSYCNGGSDGGAYDDDEKGLDAFNNGITPSGYGTCGNSPTTFFQQAYTTKTLGSSNIQCTSTQQVSPNSFKIPTNPLLL